MCGCHLLYPGYVCDAHLRERLRGVGRHTSDCYEIVPRAEFERRRDESED